MTDNKAIEDIQFLARRYDELQEVNMSVSQESLDMAIKAIEECEKYRAIGTVEGYELAIKSSIEYYNLMKKYKEKVQDFEAIGTIEEFKALKEKNEAKKVIVKKSEKIELDVCDEKGNVHLCPTCNDYIICSDVKHCWNCGQALEH